MPLPTAETRIQRPSIRDEVYTQLLNWIMDGTLKPGEKIVDKELAGHLGVSRTPVREALRRLEDKDLIESSANRWTRVAVIPPNEPEMIYPVIWALEKLALAGAINTLTQADLADMETANNRFRQALADKDPAAASQADADFHQVFINRSGNIHLMNILEDLKIRYRRLEVIFFKELSRDDSSIDEHKAIMQALADRDLDRAGHLLRSNWQKSLERFKTFNRDPVPEQD